MGYGGYCIMGGAKALEKRGREKEDEEGV